MLKRIKDWWRGEFSRTPIENALNNEPFENYKKPWLRRTLEGVSAYIKKHSMALLAIILGAIVTLFVHFDSKPAKETPKEEDHQIRATHHNLSTSKETSND